MGPCLSDFTLLLESSQEHSERFPQASLIISTGQRWHVTAFRNSVRLPCATTNQIAFALPPTRISYCFISSMVLVLDLTVLGPCLSDFTLLLESSQEHSERFPQASLIMSTGQRLHLTAFRNSVRLPCTSTHQIAFALPPTRISRGFTSSMVLVFDLTALWPCLSDFTLPLESSEAASHCLPEQHATALYLNIHQIAFALPPTRISRGFISSMVLVLDLTVLGPCLSDFTLLLESSQEHSERFPQASLIISTGQRRHVTAFRNSMRLPCTSTYIRLHLPCHQQE